jgi:hypothetical protein
MDELSRCVHDMNMRPDLESSTNAVPSAKAGHTKLRFVASAVMAIALAGFAATYFTYLVVLWNPARFGDFGLFLEPTSRTVEQVDPGSPADEAGIKRGDIIERPPLRDRLILLGNPRPGERLNISIPRGNERLSVTLRARTLPPLSFADRALTVVKFIWGFVFLAVGLLLVLLRPSMMTWGFYLLALNVLIVWGTPNEPLPYLPATWVIPIGIAQWIIAPAGLAGLLIFSVRFPNNAPASWGKALERVAGGIFVVASSFLIYSQVCSIQFAPVSKTVVVWAVGAMWALVTAGTIVLLNALLRGRGVDENRITRFAQSAACLMAGLGAFDIWHQVTTGRDLEDSIIGVTLVGTAAFVTTAINARGLERQRIKWVVFGLVCVFAAGALDLTWSAGVPTTPRLVAALELLYVALPLTVAYAVIRHRVIDVRFVARRSIVVGVIALILVLIAVALDWLFSAKLPNSRFENAAYVGVALLVGLSLNAVTQVIGKVVDALLFRQWHGTQERARAIADAIYRARSEQDLYEPLTAHVAETFSIASVALFHRVEGGGFVRVAARGWPPNTIWHILADDPLVLRATKPQRIVQIAEVQWSERDLPAGVARPALMLPIVAGKQVPGMLLCGTHGNGTALDPDEIRTIRDLCVDAGAVYNVLPSAESEREAVFDRQVQPLRA